MLGLWRMCRLLIDTTVITKVFPDEYHLHTLDQMLSAISRLNPHVDMKKIVIGLMDRLSTFAQRESENTSPEEKQKAEEEATIRLMEKMQLSKDKKPHPGLDDAESASNLQSNGTKPDETPSEANESTISDATTAVNGDGAAAKSSKPPSVTDVKLFEIFYDQVVNLVKTRGLSIQDTMALLTSLVNLAL
jgi:vacuolar protein sorting-associated protein 35